MDHSFLDHVEAQKGRWRDSAAEAKGVSTRYYWTGRGRDALEVAYGTAESKLNATTVREVWKPRHGRAAAPLLVVVGYPKVRPHRAMVCGPAGEDPPVVDLGHAHAERLAAAALADQSRRQREAGQAFARESVNAYMDFFDTAFSQYREGNQRAAGRAQEGARAVSESVAGLLGTATGVAGATAGAAADATRTSAESAAGQPPFSDYDEMNVDEITEQLDGLSEAELRRARNYEQGNKNRETLIAQIDRRLEASS